MRHLVWAEVSLRYEERCNKCTDSRDNEPSSQSTKPHSATKPGEYRSSNRKKDKQRKLRDENEKHQNLVRVKLGSASFYKMEKQHNSNRD